MKQIASYFYLVCALISLVVSALPLFNDFVLTSLGAEFSLFHTFIFFLCVPCFVYLSEDVKRQTK